jgi:uncharacterized membrane-anchored protein YjiN (DUF445 family)
MSTPDLLAGFDELRARRLRRMKLNASGLLVLAALVFIATFVFTDGTGWTGYVRAAAEAGMVGGVADWFAVTALFRHPLGIPIPHTALIPRGKDAIGRGLGEFVQRNFMSPDSLVERVRDAHLSKRLGEWLADDHNARVASRQAAAIIAALAETVNEDEIQDSLREVISNRIDAVDAAPMLGSLLSRAVSGGHHEMVVTAGMRAIGKAIGDNQDLIRRRIYAEAPRWVPGYVNEIVYEKIYVSLQQFIADVAQNPEHEIRKLLDERLVEWVDQLQTSPELATRGNELKRRLQEHPEFKEWTDGIWTSVKEHIAAAAEQPESDLRTRLEQLSLSTGQRLLTDNAVRDGVDAWISNLARHLAERSGPEVASLIATTVERWDADETSHRLELQVGRDLQFIRINGTVVGSLVGLLLHTLVETFG